MVVRTHVMILERHGCPACVTIGTTRNHYIATTRECADRELNPGYELGKLMSYH
jgi:hypothetical protein